MRTRRAVKCRAALPSTWRPFEGPDPARIDEEGFYIAGPGTPRPIYEQVDANKFNKVRRARERTRPCGLGSDIKGGIRARRRDPCGSDHLTRSIASIF